MLRDLHILLAVVQCKSMARAAERLAISKPVISKVIANLEHVLGVRLLERDRHGAEPTTYGAALLRRGITVFDELRAGVKEIEFLVDPTAGDVRIGCNPILATSFVPAVIDKLSRRFPRIVFHVVARQADTLHRELIDRNVDFLVARRLGALTDERLKFEVLFDDREVASGDAPENFSVLFRVLNGVVVRANGVFGLRVDHSDSAFQVFGRGSGNQIGANRHGKEFWRISGPMIGRPCALAVRPDITNQANPQAVEIIGVACGQVHQMIRPVYQSPA